MEFTLKELFYNLNEADSAGYDTQNVDHVCYIGDLFDGVKVIIYDIEAPEEPFDGWDEDWETMEAIYDEKARTREMDIYVAGVLSDWEYYPSIETISIVE